MKHILTIKDRLILVTLLPSKGDIITLKIVDKLKDRLALSEEEIAKYDICKVADFSKGCPKCKSEELTHLPYSQIVKCPKCDFKGAMGVPGSVVWRTNDPEGKQISQETEIEFGETGLRVIKEALVAVSKAKNLTPDLIPLYERFCGEQKVEI